MTEESSDIDTERTRDDMHIMEGLGSKLVAYCRNIVGRRGWTEDQRLANDEVVSDVREARASTDLIEIKTKVKAALKHCEGKIRAQRTAAVRKETKDKLRIQREANHPRAAEGGQRPPAPARVQFFKTSDTPKTRHNSSRL